VAFFYGTLAAVHASDRLVPSPGSALFRAANLPPLKPTDWIGFRPEGEQNRIESDHDRWGHPISYAASFAQNEKRKRRPRREKPDSTQREPPPIKEMQITTPLLDAISQNTIGYSEGYPAGVPREYAWCSGSYKPLNSSIPPLDFNAVTGWGQVYPKAGTPAHSTPEAMVEIANAKTYVHLKSGEWVLVQDQMRNQIVGGHFVTDFAGNAGVPMVTRTLPGGGMAFAAPPTGYNDHFWHSTRGTYTPGSVNGVYVEMDMRTNDPKANLIANIGADWWRDVSAEYVAGFANNPGAGMSNWIQLSTEWKTLRFYSSSTAQLQDNPPPPLIASANQEKPGFTRRFSVSTIYCQPAPRRQTQ